MEILALSDRLSPSGIFCLASILWIFIALCAYSKGWVAGGFTCFLLLIASLILCGDDRGKSSTDNIIAGQRDHYITNKSQTKWLQMGESRTLLDKGNAIFRDNTGYDEYGRPNPCLFIPDEELMLVDGWVRMKPDGRKITDDDYYIWDFRVDKLHAPEEAGGGGIPQWVYHPASSTYIFGLGALPLLAAGAILKK